VISLVVMFQTRHVPCSTIRHVIICSSPRHRKNVFSDKKRNILILFSIPSEIVATHGGAGACITHGDGGVGTHVDGRVVCKTNTSRARVNKAFMPSKKTSTGEIQQAKASPQKRASTHRPRGTATTYSMLHSSFACFFLLFSPFSLVAVRVNSYSAKL
jgi:hypothetical protein